MTTDIEELALVMLGTTFTRCLMQHRGRNTGMETTYRIGVTAASIRGNRLTGSTAQDFRLNPTSRESSKKINTVNSIGMKCSQ